MKTDKEKRSICKNCHRKIRLSSFLNNSWVHLDGYTSCKTTIAEPSPKKYKCSTCEGLFEKKCIHFCEDPYASEINDDHSKDWYCDECLDSSTGDI